MFSHVYISAKFTTKRPQSLVIPGLQNLSKWNSTSVQCFQWVLVVQMVRLVLRNQCVQIVLVDRAIQKAQEVLCVQLVLVVQMVLGVLLVQDYQYHLLAQVVQEDPVGPEVQCSLWVLVGQMARAGQVLLMAQ